MELARIRDVDAQLARQAHADADVAHADAGEETLDARPLTWPWRRLTAGGERREGVVHLRVVLEAGARA